MKPDHNSNLRPDVRGTQTKTGSTDTTTPAPPAGDDNNWRWWKRIEADERIAEAAIRKREADAIKKLDQDK